MSKAALITGAAKRIGAEIAIELAKSGYDIALHYNSSEDEALRTQEEILKIGVQCRLFKGDLEDKVYLSELIKAVYSSFPDLNVLVNNASIFERASIPDTDFELFEKLIDVNLKAPYFLIKEFAKVCGSGNIINILDTKITKNQNVYAAYILSRKALSDLTKIAAVEFAPRIRVNGICPGLILPAENESEEYVERLIQKNLVKRKGSPENITSTVKFLLENDFITGEIIKVDGGENLIC
ncbi:MAG: SDR family oxidoreductase [Candidatus Delongbacteria bacterium]|jgi:pteridine reductase|nr:SDR family oxidoreductase [Candidatus Delongbacteria bacterium]